MLTVCCLCAACVLLVCTAWLLSLQNHAWNRLCDISNDLRRYLQHIINCDAVTALYDDKASASTAKKTAAAAAASSEKKKQPKKRGREDEPRDAVPAVAAVSESAEEEAAAAAAEQAAKLARLSKRDELKNFLKKLFSRFLSMLPHRDSRCR